MLVLSTETNPGTAVWTQLVNTSQFDLYVDFSTGSDENDGLTPTTAKRTIQNAIYSAGPLVQRFARGPSGAVPPAVNINVAAGTDTQSIQLTGPLMVPVEFPPAPLSSSQSFIRYSLGIKGAAPTVVDTDTITSIVVADPLDPAPAVLPLRGGRQQLVCAGASWTPNAYRGLLIRGTDAGGATIYATCSGNTANTLYVSRGAAFTTAAPNNIVSIVQPSTRITNSTVFIGNGVMARIEDIEFDNSAAVGLTSSWALNEGRTLGRVDLIRCIVRLLPTAETSNIPGAHNSSSFITSPGGGFYTLYVDDINKCTFLDIDYVNVGPPSPVGSKAAASSANQYNYCENANYGLFCVAANVYPLFFYESTFNVTSGVSTKGLQVGGNVLTSGLLVRNPGGPGIVVSVNNSTLATIGPATVVDANQGLNVGVSNSARVDALYFSGCTNPIYLESQSRLYLTSLSGLNNNTGSTITQFAGSSLIYVNPLTALGCATELTRDGVASTFAAAPVLGAKGSIFSPV